MCSFTFLEHFSAILEKKIEGRRWGGRKDTSCSASSIASLKDLSPLEHRGQAGITWLELNESPSPPFHVVMGFLLAELWVKGFPVRKGLMSQLCTP